MTEEKLPNFKAVTLEEAIAWSDENLDIQSTDERPSGLRGWVQEENAARERDQIEFEAASFEAAGVTLSPGDCAILTTKEDYGRKTARKFNCVIVCQQVNRPSYGRPEHAVRFRQYGAKGGTYVHGREQQVFIHNVIKAEKVEAPDWVAAAEADRKERGW